MAANPSATVRIAVADDDDAVRTTFVNLIRAIGHEVVCAARNGRELLEGCAAKEVDLVLADFDMPGMDGLEVAEHMAVAGVPVVLVSGYAEVDQIVLEHEPVALVLRKPVTLDTLREVIQDVPSGRLLRLPK